MNRKLFGAIAVGGATIAAAVAGGLAFAGGSSAPPSPPGLDHVSNPGRSVAASAHDAETLARGGGRAELRLLGNVGSAVFYRAPGVSGGSCYGSGPASTGHIAILACPTTPIGTPTPAFPSESQPILDMSASVYNAETHTTRLAELSGVAADGVAKVAVVGADANLRRAFVSNNLYHVDFDTPFEATKIVAFDLTGREIYSFSLTT